MLRNIALSLGTFATLVLLCVSAHAKSAEDAKSYINKVATQALATIEAQGDKAAKQKKLEKLFSDSVDIAWVGRFVMGRHWRQATDAQKKQYLKEYERFILHHYTSRFTDYTSGSFTITGAKDDGDGEYTVSMSLQDTKKKGEPPVLVDYRVRKHGGSFQIFDVIVEGVSMITTQRSEFASVLSKHDIDYLIAQLGKKSVTETVQ